jgi:cytochrome c oxidase subunit IV
MSPLRKVAASPGATAIIALAALTAVEYLVSIAGVPAAFLWLTIIAVVKAGVIVMTFMHLMSVFGGEAR